MNATPPEEDNSTRGIGKSMAIVAWIAGLYLATQLFGNWEARQINPNPDPSSVQGAAGETLVRLARNRQGHYVSGGRINGREVTFLLDTGATDVVIPETIAERLNLPHLGSSYASTANGVIQVERTRIDRLNLGGIELRDVSASINPSAGGIDEILLGMSALGQLELRQQGRELTLIQHF